MNSAERWKPIAGFEGIYSVSNLGSVRIEIRRHNIQAGNHLKMTPDKDGYFQVRLSVDGRKRKAKRVNRLVAAMFIGPIPPGMQVNHLNGDVADNRLANLEIVTPKQNIAHSIEVLGHSRSGEANPAAKLTEADVVELRELADDGATYRSLGLRFGISRVAVGLIVRGRTWKDAGGPICSGRSKTRTVLCDEEATAVLAAAFDGEDIEDLAMRHGIVPNTIRGWMSGKARPHLLAAVRPS